MDGCVNGTFKLCLPTLKLPPEIGFLAGPRAQSDERNHALPTYSVTASEQVLESSVKLKRITLCVRKWLHRKWLHLPQEGLCGRLQDCECSARPTVFATIIPSLRREVLQVKLLPGPHTIQKCQTCGWGVLSGRMEESMAGEYSEAVERPRAGVALNANTLADQAQDARQLCSVTSRTVSVSQTPKAQISVPSHRSWMRSAAARATYSVVHPARKSTAAPSESWLVASDVDGLSDGQYEVCCTSTAACTTEFASNTASLASYFALPPQAQECPHTCIPDGRAKV